MKKTGQKSYICSQEDISSARAILHKDEEAFTLFYNTHQSGIYRYIKRQLRDQKLAEELTHDVFLEFIEALRTFRYSCSLKTFLYTIARNKTIDIIRKKRIKTVFFSAMPDYIVESITAVFMDDTLEQKELAEKIDRVFDRLPNDYKVILRLKYIEGHRMKRIAQQLSMKFKAAESLLYRARRLFMQEFTQLP